VCVCVCVCFMILKLFQNLTYFKKNVFIDKKKISMLVRGSLTLITKKKKDC